MALVFWWENSVIFILSQYTILQLFKDFILQLCHTRGYSFVHFNTLIYSFILQTFILHCVWGLNIGHRNKIRSVSDLGELCFKQSLPLLLVR